MPHSVAMLIAVSRSAYEMGVNQGAGKKEYGRGKTVASDHSHCDTSFLAPTYGLGDLLTQWILDADNAHEGEIVLRSLFRVIVFR